MNVYSMIRLGASAPSFFFGSGFNVNGNKLAEMNRGAGQEKKIVLRYM